MSRSIQTLGSEERLRLLRFVCSFAWADLRVTEAERAAVGRLMTRLGLVPEEASAVEQWLRIPPPPEDLDPTEVPPEHRRLFLDEVSRVAVADGHLAEEERESLLLFERLLPER